MARVRGDELIADRVAVDHLERLERVLHRRRVLTPSEHPVGERLDTSPAHVTEPRVAEYRVDLVAERRLVVLEDVQAEAVPVRVRTLPARMYSTSRPPASRIVIV